METFTFRFMHTLRSRKKWSYGTEYSLPDVGRDVKSSYGEIPKNRGGPVFTGPSGHIMRSISFFRRAMIRFSSREI